MNPRTWKESAPTTLTTMDASEFIYRTLTLLRQLDPIPSTEKDIIALFESLPSSMKPIFIFKMPTDVPSFERKLRHELMLIYPPIKLTLPDTQSTTLSIPFTEHHPKRRNRPIAPRICYNCRKPGHEVKHCRPMSIRK